MKLNAFLLFAALGIAPASAQIHAYDPQQLTDMGSLIPASERPGQTFTMTQTSLIDGIVLAAHVEGTPTIAASLYFLDSQGLPTGMAIAYAEPQPLDPTPAAEPDWIYLKLDNPITAAENAMLAFVIDSGASPSLWLYASGYTSPQQRTDPYAGGRALLGFTGAEGDLAFAVATLPVPEPGLTMLALGGCGAAAMRRRRPAKAPA